MNLYVLGDLLNDYGFVIASVVGSLIVLALMTDLIRRRRKTD
ncbi:EYxxD motif small membrane protein [Melghirimyces algeriensis]|uniref:Uncharacterized protein n=1 Tax=Melghirimyces algeriensis TaxID=910412 RepID=A0A521DRZ7_9BACL|nr:EYxxD motif small membrane protein [Melghirimyces algeriensis]SMO74477.1 hypothetical protein SAMN06264849_106203 [Melghirimyces algeriensis]